MVLPRTPSKDALIERLKGRARPVTEGDKPAPQKPTEKPPEAKPEDKPQGEPEPEDPMGEEGEPAKTDEKTVEGEKPAGEEKVVDGDKKKEKVNPWKLVEEHKTGRAAAEKEIAELKKLVPNAELRKREMEEVENLRKRNDELENHMKFVDFRESTEYKEKYEKPYQSQWTNSMKELAGVTVEDDNGTRDIGAKDMFELVNLPLAKARQVAIEKFGDFADDVMSHRQQIRDKFEAREQAIENAKKEGAEKYNSQMQQSQSQVAEISTKLKSTYEQITESISKDSRHAPYIAEREGDDEGNSMLKRGYDLVDKAFAANPMAPGLTHEQRATIVKQHAAVRHKAAAYGRLIRDLKSLKAQHAKATEELAQFKQTVPGRGENPQPNGSSGGIPGGSKMDAMKNRLRGMAKPITR